MVGLVGFHLQSNSMSGDMTVELGGNRCRESPQGRQLRYLAGNQPSSSKTMSFWHTIERKLNTCVIFESDEPILLDLLSIVFSE